MTNINFSARLKEQGSSLANWLTYLSKSRTWSNISYMKNNKIINLKKTSDTRVLALILYANNVPDLDQL